MSQFQQCQTLYVVLLAKNSVRSAYAIDPAFIITLKLLHAYHKLSPTVRSSEKRMGAQR